MSNKPTISSKKITLISDYNHFDLLPLKKFHECTTRIPETILLEKGFIKQWVFNSHKIQNHPILKKKKQNTSPLAVVKTFCTKMGYGPVIQGASNIRQIRDIVSKALNEQKDYDFVKDKKVVQIVTVSNETLLMSLMDFLDYTSENKYSDQNFYEKWKMIQEKVSFTKIDECYQVQNIRHNHVIESKCQKIISVNSGQANPVSTELLDDPYRKVSPGKNFQIAETKTLQGYKFFDTFLNKKFFQMSNQLIEFIEKNLKCLVESVNTKFVINKDRQPYLVGIYDLVLKPVKKIGDMKQFQLCKEKGYAKVEEYQRFLEIYISDHMDRNENYTINTPISERRGKCRGKFCKLPISEGQLPPLLQQKLKLPGLSANTRTVGIDLRDAVIKRKMRVFQKLAENKVLPANYEDNDESSEYSTSGQNQEAGTHVNITRKNKQLKICHKCFVLFFHVNRFYELDVYGNLIQKKNPLTNTTSSPNFTNDDQQALKSKIENLRRQKDLANKKTINGSEIADKDQTFKEKEENTEKNANTFTLDIHPITSTQKVASSRKKSESNKRVVSSSKKKVFYDKDNILTASPVKALRKNNTQKQLKSQKKLPPGVKSKVKLDPLSDKKAIMQSSGDPYVNQKTNRILTLTKLTQPMKLQQRQKSKTVHQGMLPLKERRPQNHEEAINQIIKKFQNIPDSSKDQFIFYAKKYYKDNLPQPLDRRYFSTYYIPDFYEFMSVSPIGIHPKKRIKKRPQMSLKRLSQLTDYPEIVSRSQFIFDTIIVNQQTTIPFCVITTKVVNPDNLRTGIPFQNIFFVHDMFDCFIQHISTAKEILEEDEIYNKRIVLFNYPGQSHTVYNQGNTFGYIAYFAQVMDKLIFRLSTEKTQLKIIDLEKDMFKFYGFGVGGFLLQGFLGSYSSIFRPNSINGVMLVNSFMRFPEQYEQLLQNLQQLYDSDDPTVESQAYLYYNKGIGSEEVSPDQMEHKSGLNPIRVQDRLYILESLLNELEAAGTQSYSLQASYFQQLDHIKVSCILGRQNIIVPKESMKELLYYRNNPKKQIPNRVYIEIDGGHDIFADNYGDIARVITMFAKR